MTRIATRSIVSMIIAVVVSGCAEPQFTIGPSEPVIASIPIDPSQQPLQPSEGRLALVRERGNLICGVNGSRPGFSFLEDDESYTGFDADFCRAVAAAVLGDPEAVEFLPVSVADREPALQLGQIDVLIRNTSWTVSRDTSWGLFAPTTFHDGQAIMVDRTLVDATTIDELDGATICVEDETSTEENLVQRLGSSVEPIGQSSIDAAFAAYEEGRCDGITTDLSVLASRRAALVEPSDHVILDPLIGKGPLGPVVPLGDDEWFNVVKWVVYATIGAEELGITQANVADLEESSDDPVVQRLLGVTPAGSEPFDSGLGLEPDWVVAVIGAVGNYGEIYERHLGPDTIFGLDRGMNRLWTDGGLLYAPPYR